MVIVWGSHGTIDDRQGFDDPNPLVKPSMVSGGRRVPEQASRHVALPVQCNHASEGVSLQPLTRKP